MGFQNKIYSTALAAAFFFIINCGWAKAGTLQIVGDSSGNRGFNRASLPKKETLKLVARGLSAEGGVMALYDDAATKRLVDYAEIFKPTGELLAVIWFDKFGILRSAIDRGVYLKHDDVEGVMVVVLYADPV